MIKFFFGSFSLLGRLDILQVLFQRSNFVFYLFLRSAREFPWNNFPVVAEQLEEIQELCSLLFTPPSDVSGGSYFNVTSAAIVFVMGFNYLCDLCPVFLIFLDQKQKFLVFRLFPSNGSLRAVSFNSVVVRVVISAVVGARVDRDRVGVFIAQLSSFSNSWSRFGSNWPTALSHFAWRGLLIVVVPLPVFWLRQLNFVVLVVGNYDVDRVPFFEPVLAVQSRIPALNLLGI